MYRHSMIGTMAAIALASAGTSFPGYDNNYHRPRRTLKDFTIDEIEELWVREQLAHARTRRRQEERQRQQIEDARLAAEAAAIEAARPKSRQELRAKERRLQKRGSYDREHIKPKSQSETLKRLLKGKRQ